MPSKIRKPKGYATGHFSSADLFAAGIPEKVTEKVVNQFGKVVNRVKPKRIPHKEEGCLGGCCGREDGQIELGDLAKDNITGFTGIVVARTEWINNCTRFTLQPQKLKDGTPIEQQTFDEMQLRVLKENVIRAHQVTGGPRPSPRRTKDPR
jgi:hypothetical protein